jgi:hypothetical protein
MPLLTSRAPRPALAEHPAFALMLQATLERYHCTLGEVREDYWLGRAWRALAGDPMLRGRVARFGVGSALVTGPDFSALPTRKRERDHWRLHVQERLLADTGRAPNALGMVVRFAERDAVIAEACVRSLLAQTVVSDPRFDDLDAYAADLAVVVAPVACAAEGVVAA